MSAIASPCILVCTIDDETRLCMGCYRTLSEIGAWPSLSDPEKSELLATLKRREAATGPFPVKSARPGARRR